MEAILKVFCAGAVKAAVMVEDVARTVWLALQVGQPDEIAPEDVARLHQRYTHEYGKGVRFEPERSCWISRTAAITR